MGHAETRQQLSLLEAAKQQAEEEAARVAAEAAEARQGMRLWEDRHAKLLETKDAAVQAR